MIYVELNPEAPIVEVGDPMSLVADGKRYAGVVAKIFHGDDGGRLIYVKLAADQPVSLH